ncbi:hypothetical protein M9Y10_004488 [Tritrichomonas musculus]|uniref:IQ calmodulin-binding motif family protein n=1 Tax=Tritrichomonas musculus TaxID=1915356 RepID=A0ABR2GJ60_9EUKA
MNASSSPTSNFIDALISSKSATVNVSQWYSNILNLYSSKVDRLNRKKKWIDLAKRFLAYKFKENLYNEQATISKYVFVDATKLIWRSLSKKLLLYSRINVIKYFHAQLLRVNYERHFNIKIQWKSYAWALLHGLESPKHSYRELWRSYAFLIKKKKIKEAQHNCDKFSFHGKTQTRIIWQRFFRFIISDFRIKQMRKKVKAIAILTQFFNHSLIRFRAKKAAEAVTLLKTDYSFTKPFIDQSCKKVNHFAKLYLIRRAKDFSQAYADETFKTSFVHILNAVSSYNSP